MKTKVLSLLLALSVVTGCRALSTGGSIDAHLREQLNAQAWSRKNETALKEDLLTRILRLNNRGVARLEAYEYASAAAQFREALELKPDFTPSLVNLGIALYYDSNYSKAEEALKAALKLDPAEAHAHFTLGLIYDKVNKRDEAQQ